MRFLPGHAGGTSVLKVLTTIWQNQRSLWFFAHNICHALAFQPSGPGLPSAASELTAMKIVPLDVLQQAILDTANFAHAQLYGFSLDTCKHALLDTVKPEVAEETGQAWDSVVMHGAGHVAANAARLHYTQTHQESVLLDNIIVDRSVVYNIPFLEDLMLPSSPREPEAPEVVGPSGSPEQVSSSVLCALCSLVADVCRQVSAGDEGSVNIFPPLIPGWLQAETDVPAQPAADMDNPSGALARLVTTLTASPLADLGHIVELVVATAQCLSPYARDFDLLAIELTLGLWRGARLLCDVRFSLHAAPVRSFTMAALASS